MMNGKGVIFAAVLALTPGLLFAARVKVDFEKTTDFSKYKTYSWGKAQEGDPAEQPMDGNLKSAIEESLAARGWTLAKGAADVVISRELRSTEHERVGSESSGIGNGVGMGGGDFQRTAMVKVPVKSLTLTMTDTAGKKEIWKAVVLQDLKSDSPDKIEKALTQEAKRLFAKFPPGVKK